MNLKKGIKVEYPLFILGLDKVWLWVYTHNRDKLLKVELSKNLFIASGTLLDIWRILRPIKTKKLCQDLTEQAPEV